MFASLWLASLPDLAEPSILPFGAAAGAFLAQTASRLRRGGPDSHAEQVVTGSYYGMGMALAIYLIVNLVEVVF
jgi:hypothetical protein